ncbi:MAG: RecQ family ATP-dependent DNA helicase [Treponema sp.]|jgi:ATP-dependent DNA helicase RecQ|nr:RecQ family ATP-dependent DNA helicase [Treponema sp.]
MDERDPLTDAARRLFGVSYLFPYQRLVVSNILEAADAAGVQIRRLDGEENKETDSTDKEPPYGEGRQIVVLPTGAGKSLCFQLPGLLLQGATLIVYPILSLMADQERRLIERGFAPAVLRGGQTQEERAALWEKLKDPEPRFIITNPETLLIPKTLERLRSLGVVHIVIDEAHCVSEWGESFRPAYLRIGEIISALSAPLVTAFTATASAPVLEKIDAYIFGGQGARQVVGNPDRVNISYSAQGCILRDAAVRDIIRENQRPAIVFCSSRIGAEKLARYLRNELGDKEIRFYHAGLSREEKTAVEKWFLKNPTGILVATCAFGMGVDKADIRTVVHRDCPPSVEAYLQESGRAGRDGSPSKAVLLWGPDDVNSLKRAKTQADQSRLSALLNYAEDTTKCRRRILLDLLNYEGEIAASDGVCCDVCAKTAKKTLREEVITPFFKKYKRCFTPSEAVELLAQDESLGWTDRDVRKAIQSLVQYKKLTQIKNIFWKNKLTVRENKRIPR